MPSAFCGVTGLRPTHGRVSNAGVLPVSQTFDTVGPIARDVGDVARLFSVIAGFDPSDPLSQDVPFDDWCRDPSSAIEGLKIGIPKNFYFNGVEDDFASAVMILARTLEAGGAKLVEVDIPNAEIAHEYATRIIFSDVCAFHANSLDHQRDKISNQVFERMVEGRNVTGVAYADALRFKENWRRMLGNLFDTVNVTLFPTTPAAAPLIHDNQHLSEATKSATRFTYGSGLAGTPGLSLPCGFDANGLPIGALFETRWWGENTLFRLGAYWQSLTDWHQQKPKLRPGPNT
jgi:aspartyl-tRNA(Asn)/glutamyl-tRNA(Gln) amidotransferase subunit A